MKPPARNEGFRGREQPQPAQFLNRAVGDDDVLDIRGTTDQGMDDDVLWARMLNERRLLITTDKGFAHHRSESHYGILIVRLRQPNEAKIRERVMRAIRQFSESEWPGLLVVMRDAVQSVSRAEQN